MRQLGFSLLLCTILLPFLAFGQTEPGYNKMSLGANFELSLPVGDFSNIAGVGYGGNVRYQYGADTRANFTATAGYIVWTKMNLPSLLQVQPLETSASHTIQPKAFNFFLGGKYYLQNGLYGSLEGGVYFVSYTYQGVSGGEMKDNNSFFMLPIGVGFQKSGIEVGVRYMLLHPDFNQVSITFGYNFEL